MKHAQISIITLMTLFTACRNKTEVISPIIAPITDAVFASGHIEPVDQFTLTAFSEGYLQRAWVKENDVAQKTQLLFTLDNTNASIEETAAAKNLKLAIQNASRNSPTLSQIQAELYNAQKKLANDSAQYERMKRLYKTKSVAEVEFETAQLAYESSASTVKSIEENLQATNITLQQNLINSQKQYLSSAAGSKYFLLTAKERQKVYRVLKKEGELIRKGDAVALLGHPDSLLIMLTVDETGISKVKAGQQVLVELNTHPGAMFPATVATIYPYFDEETQAYKVEAFFNKQPSGIIAGTLLQANIIVATKSKTILIPRAYLTPDEKVILEHGRKADTTTIKTGIISTEWVEVLEGLTVRDKLIKAN